MTNVLDLLPNARRAGTTNGGEYAGPCPWCGGKDRFRVWPLHESGKPRFWCRQCNRSGDGIDLVRELKGLTYSEAAVAVGQPMVDRPAPAFRKRQEPPLCPPSPTWQSKAEEVAEEAEAALWQPEGARPLAYLRRRGFEDDTIRAARLGYVPDDRREAPELWGLPSDHNDVWLPRGISIPWRACGSLWRLNVRRATGEPKYCGPAGYTQGLYGADGLHRGYPVVLCEGEFDALAAAQEAGDKVTAVATGSTSGSRHRRWTRALAAAPVVMVAYDADDAGEQAASWWLGAIPGSKRLVPEGDPAKMLEMGADVREWVRAGSVLR